MISIFYQRNKSRVRLYSLYYVDLMVIDTISWEVKKIKNEVVEGNSTTQPSARYGFAMEVITTE